MAAASSPDRVGEPDPAEGLDRVGGVVDPLDVLRSPVPTAVARAGARLRAEWETRRARLVVVTGIAVAVVAVGAAAVLLRPAARSEADLPSLPMTRAGTDPATARKDAHENPPATGGSVGSRGTDPVTIWVDVAGAVARPGLVALVPGARVAEAVSRAGGFTADADVDRVNQAAILTDAERVYIPRRGDVTAPSVIAGGGSSADGRHGGGGGGGAGVDTTPSDPTPAPVDVNTATASQLDALPGVGPATAAAIISYREEHGRFATVDQLADVRGIGPAKLEQLRPLVTVG